MSAGSDANPPDEISRDSEHHGSAGEVAQANLRPLEEHEQRVTALRLALIEGENSGAADDLDIKKIKQRRACDQTVDASHLTFRCAAHRAMIRSIHV